MTSPALHLLGRQALLTAWPKVTGETPNAAELQIAGAVAGVVEGVYGQAAFKNLQTGQSRVINNWGAVQAGSPPCDGVTSWEATDTSPSKITADNPRGEYQVCFRIYPTPADGAEGFIRQVTIRRPESWAAMKVGDIDAFSAAMHTRHGSIGAYYEGFGPTAAVQIDHHAAAVWRGVQEIAAALGEPIAATRGGAPAPNADSGSFLGDLVAAVGGTVLGVVAFRTWQRKHGRR